MTDQPTREAIAPCPAGHPYVRTNRTFTNLGERWYANCVDCAWQGPLAATEPAAIFIWNTRALSTPQPAIDQAVAAEKERCAGVVEYWQRLTDPKRHAARREMLGAIAAAIRATPEGQS